ncbi:serine--tRNA ligase [Paenibacillus montanisoli]|uniref:Serine--tRNA ligase n=1 Tax=Paenibacillus montanisoli TaxID=2081970 RepID=A0A328UE92_9BACL|nr:serine--tRNA ligase [Paenibacillus montanisoli]RAP78266.1 serine--tRNA ligase [Paenibacillus montanisoli]
MLDMNMIRKQADDYQEAADWKGISISIGELIETDDRRRELLQETEALRAERNRRSKAIERLMLEGRKEEAEPLKRETAELLQRLKEAESKFRQTAYRYEELMLRVPNLTSPDTPMGKSDADNVEVRREGDVPDFPFNALSHVELGERHGMFDFARGVKLGGTRQYVLKNSGLQLHRAVQQLALDMLADKGYELMDVPALVKEETLVASGYFPANRDQTYGIQGEDKWLIGTSEVPLVSYFSGEVLDLAAPKLIGAVSPCYRSEVGSSGRDVHGLYRVHQFAKVEQVVICQAKLETALALLEQMTANGEELLRLLELPYRVVAVCAGDMSQKNYKQYDIETWMPSRDGYGETHSASLLLDFQARRSNIRYLDENGKSRFAYTLNNTMVATPRILIPLLENHQREDGSIHIPKALRPYMRGLSELRPQHVDKV